MPAQFQSREWRASPRDLSRVGGGSGIHDDAQAQELGFDGGFVPGASLYEHITAEMLNQGADWLNEGRAEMRFRRPVYHDAEVSFSIDADEYTFTIRGDDDRGTRSTGSLALDHDAPKVPAGTPAAPFGAPLGDPAQVGVLMRIEQTLDPGLFDEMAAITSFPRESSDGHKLMPVARWVNPISMIYEYFGPSTTVHFASRIWHHSPLYEDESFSTSGVITDFSERRGNQIVDFTALVAAADGRPIATIAHSSVYRLARQHAAEA